MHIPLVYEHLFYKYFVRQSVSQATKGKKASLHMDVVILAFIQKYVLTIHILSILNILKYLLHEIKLTIYIYPKHVYSIVIILKMMIWVKYTKCAIHVIQIPGRHLSFLVLVRTALACNKYISQILH